MTHEHNITNENEKKTLTVIIFTVITMFAEIIYGYITHSMALLADGYHMGTHALALGLTFIAYVLIRKFKNSPKFPNGTDKIGTLTAYTSSLFLGFTGIWIIIEAVERLINPIKIEFNEAILVALIGLTVNTLCILIMEGGHFKKCVGNKCVGGCCVSSNCECVHHNEHHHDKTQEDFNFMSAYYHILADALTSILAIIALLVGKFFNLTYFDPIIGILGGILIIRWSIGLLKKTVTSLIDMN